METQVFGGPSATPSANGSPVLHCTLFLFDDKLMIIKRPNPMTSGRMLAGLNEVDKLTRAGGLPLSMSMKKSGLVYKGLIDITDVVVTDVGGPGEFFASQVETTLLNIL